MGFKTKKPVSFWNRQVKADFKSLFKALTKAAEHGSAQKWAEVGGDFGEVVTSLGLDRRPEEFAWLLIVRAIGRALHDLAKEYFNSRGTAVPDTIDELVNRIDLSIENVEITLTPSSSTSRGAVRFRASSRRPLRNGWSSAASLQGRQNRSRIVCRAISSLR